MLEPLTLPALRALHACGYTRRKTDVLPADFATARFHNLTELTMFMTFLPDRYQGLLETGFGYSLRIVGM